eukprot:5392117-Heterocapsa_arctica.AAC.1
MVGLTFGKLGLSPPGEIPKVENHREGRLWGHTGQVAGPAKDRIQDGDSKACLFRSGQPVPD